MKTQRISALFAGIALLIMAFAAMFTFGFVHNSLVVPNESETTLTNLKSSGLLFRAEVFGWLFIFLLDAIVSVALYLFFRDENRKLAVATSGLRLVYTAILGMAIFNFFLILNVLNGSVLVQLEEVSQKVMLYLKSFENTWTFGLIVFGFHLLVLGILVLKTRNIHLFWGILLTFAGVSYILISSSKLIFPDLESPIKTVEMVLSLPMAFGEIGFAVWLIIRGGKPKTVFRSELTV